jgi:hypothetical protein
MTHCLEGLVSVRRTIHMLSFGLATPRFAYRAEAMASTLLSYTTEAPILHDLDNGDLE